MKKTTEKGRLIRVDVNSYKMHNTKVLIIDAECSDRENFLKILRNTEVDMDIESDLEQALINYKNKEFDAIFIGEILDGESKIKQFFSRFKNTLIIGIEKKFNNDFRKILMLEGVELILHKPVKSEQLAVIFRNELQDKMINI